MRKTLTRALVPVVAAGMIGSTLAVGTANAAPAPVTEVETGVAADAIVGVSARFDYSDSRNIGIPALKKLRSEMWDINPRYQGMTLQQYAAEHGYPTKDEYVNSVRSDRALVMIAVQRGAEASKIFDHKRPTNSTCTLGSQDECRDTGTATYDGYRGWGENLSQRGLESSIQNGWGHGELAALNAANGFFTLSNGHLYVLLNPTTPNYGFADIVTPQGRVSVAQSSYYTSWVDNTHSGERHIWLYRAADGNERPTGIRTDDPTAIGGLTGSLDMGSLEGGLDLGSLTGGGAGDTGSAVDVMNLQNIVFLGLAAATLAAQFGMIPPLPIGIQFG